METRAIQKYVRVQPKKVRLVAREVVGKPAQHMVNVLRFHPSKGAFYLRKALMSAIANAVENSGADAGALKIAEVRIDEGPKLKRIQARAMGRANRIFKRMSHITVVVDEVEPKLKPKPHGTKAKPRPTFAKAGAKGKKPAAATEPTPAPVEEAAPESMVTEETKD